MSDYSLRGFEFLLTINFMFDQIFFNKYPMISFRTLQHCICIAHKSIEKIGFIETLIGLERGTILQNDQKSRDGFPKLWYAVKILYIPFQVRTRSSNKWLPQLLTFGDGKG